MMRCSLILSVFLVLGCAGASAQENQTADDAEGLFLNLKNINFVRNNEYSNPVTEGYTLIGYFLQPEIIYKVDEKVRLSLGANLISFSGTNRFTSIKPVFSTTYIFSENSFFRLGTLSGSDEHRLLDPHFNKERLYTDYAEDGLQFRLTSDRIFSDTWVSWENYIFSGDNEREIFTAGESFSLSVPLMNDKLRIDFPVQLLFRHYGGQISNYPEPVETYMNLAAGARIGINAGTSGTYDAGIECLFFSGRSMTNNSPWGISSGNAGWYKLFWRYDKAVLETGYWHSHNYYAPEGNFIFSSVSDHLDNLVISDRRLLTGSFNLTLPWKDFLLFSFGVEGYYDTDLKRFDNAVYLHIRFDKLIRLLSPSNQW
jgi:hypothetical protein